MVSMIALTKAGFAHGLLMQAWSQSAGGEAERSERGVVAGGGPKGEANPFMVSMIALAKAGFAHGLLMQAWSQSAGGFGEAERSERGVVAGGGPKGEANPPRVPM
jgi:hypothetical protein